MVIVGISFMLLRVGIGFSLYIVMFGCIRLNVRLGCVIVVDEFDRCVILNCIFCLWVCVRKVVNCWV